MLNIRVESSENLYKSTVLSNKVFLKIKEINKFFKNYKKRNQVSVLRAPHVFSKFKQKYARKTLSSTFKTDYNLTSVFLTHQLLEEDLPAYLKIKKQN